MDNLTLIKEITLDSVKSSWTIDSLQLKRAVLEVIAPATTASQRNFVIFVNGEYGLYISPLTTEYTTRRLIFDVNTFDGRLNATTYGCSDNGNSGQSYGVTPYNPVLLEKEAEYITSLQLYGISDAPIPAGTNIKVYGTQSAPGRVYHSWSDSTLTITSDSGTSSANLKGDTGCRGAQGAKGEPGITCAEDYYTRTEVDNAIVTASVPIDYTDTVALNYPSQATWTLKTFYRSGNFCFVTLQFNVTEQINDAYGFRIISLPFTSAGRIFVDNGKYWLDNGGRDLRVQRDKLDVGNYFFSFVYITNDAEYSAQNHFYAVHDGITIRYPFEGKYSWHYFIISKGYNANGDFVSNGSVVDYVYYKGAQLADENGNYVSCYDVSSGTIEQYPIIGATYHT